MLRVGLWDKDVLKMAFPRTYRLMGTELGPELRRPAFLSGVAWSERTGSKLQHRHWRRDFGQVSSPL